MRACAELLPFCLFVIRWTIALQVLLSIGISRQKYCSRLPFPSQGIFPTQGLNLGLLQCRQILYQLSYQVNATLIILYSFTLLSSLNLIANPTSKSFSSQNK